MHSEGTYCRAQSMPDLITHTAVAYFFSRGSRIIKNSTLFYVGTILPDILTRAFFILFPKTYFAVYPFHTPLGLLLVCLLFSFFFKEAQRKEVFLSLIAGGWLHLCLDLLQKHLEPSYALLFPFSWRTFEIGVFLPEHIVMCAPLWVAAICVNEFFARKKQ